MHYIDTGEGLAGVAERIRDTTLVAVDTEAAGYHRYHDRICLLQLSTRQETFVVDALAVEHVDPLKALLADPNVEVVFHDAEYDLRLLDRDLGVRVRGLFDTKLAAQFLGEPVIGLAGLLERYLGIHLEKKYQRADWARRPLPPEMLEYAATDTRHLPELRDMLRERLASLGRLAWAEEEFRIQEAGPGSVTSRADGMAYMRIKGTRDFTPRQLGALRELYAWRETQGRERDVAPFRIASNEALVDLARRLPVTIGEASSIPTVPRSLLARHGAELISLIREVRAQPESAMPERPRAPARPAPDPEVDQAVDRMRAVRDRAAELLGLDKGFLLPRHQLETIARAKPDSLEALASVPGVRRWQVEAVGAEILDALN